MLNSCGPCKYDWAADPYGLKIEVDVDTAQNRLASFCPQCGEPLLATEMSDLGVIRVDGRAYQWDDRALRGTVALLSQGAELPYLGTSNLFYSAVPGFAQSDGSLRVPDLPIKAEFRNLVNWRTFYDQATNCRGKVITDSAGLSYQAKVPLNGRREPMLVERPIKGLGAGVVNHISNALPGFELTVWPKIQSEIWTNFLVDARWIGQGKKAVEDLEKAKVPFWIRLCVRAGPAAGAGSGPVVPEVQDLPLWTASSVPFGSNVRRHAGHTSSTGRPLAVEVAFGVGAGAFGGMFAPAEPKPLTVSGTALPIAMGIDFGTSNSVVAFQDSSGDAKVLKPADLHEYLVRAVTNADAVLAADWVPRPIANGFGPPNSSASGTIFPTELTLSCPVAGAANALGEFVPGLDYSIAEPSVSWMLDGKALPVEQVTARQFKWLNADGGQFLAAARPALVTGFAKILLVQQAALWFAAEEERSSGVAKVSLGVHLAAPGRWPTDERTQLVAFFDAALAKTSALALQAKGAAGRSFGLLDWVDLAEASVQTLGQGEVIDEATAAYRMMSTPMPSARVPPARVLKVVADVGGGSTDVAVLWESITDCEKTNLEYLTSLRFAGEDLFRILASTATQRADRVFNPGLNDSEVSHRLRSGGVTADLFHPSKKIHVEKRIKAYYDWLVEYLARLISSLYYTGAHYRATGDQGRYLSDLSAPDGGRLGAFEIHLCLTGNGWGWADQIHANADAGIHKAVRDRTMELLKPALTEWKARGGEGGLQFHLVSLPLPKGVHKKHVVALGVLKGATPGAKPVAMQHILQVSAQESDGGLFETNDDAPAASQTSGVNWNQREIVGLNCSAGSRKIPWYAVVESNAEHHAGLQGLQQPIGPYDFLAWTLEQNTGSGDGLPPTVLDDRSSEALTSDSATVRNLVRQGNDQFLRRGLLTALLERNVRTWLEKLI